MIDDIADHPIDKQSFRAGLQAAGNMLRAMAADPNFRLVRGNEALLVAGDAMLNVCSSDELFDGP